MTMTEPTHTGSAKSGDSAHSRPRRTRMSRQIATSFAAVLVTQIALLAAFLLAWKYIPQIDALRSWGPVFDPFFISSPDAVAERVVSLATGAGDNLVWPYIWQTIWTSVLGAAVGIVLGLACGLLFSSSEFLSRVFNPFLAALNAIPRIAFIPVVVVIFGPRPAATIVIAVLVVFFIAFYNAFEGGRSVPAELVNNARVLGATRGQVMVRVRLPYVMAWTFAALPLMLGFSLLAVVTAEILAAVQGMGYLISLASVSAQSSLTFAIVVYLAVVGIVMVGVTGWMRKRLLHWWAK